MQISESIRQLNKMPLAPVLAGLFATGVAAAGIYKIVEDRQRAAAQRKELIESRALAMLKRLQENMARIEKQVAAYPASHALRELHSSYERLQLRASGILQYLAMRAARSVDHHGGEHQYEDHHDFHLDDLHHIDHLHADIDPHHLNSGHLHDAIIHIERDHDNLMGRMNDARLRMRASSVGMGSLGRGGFLGHDRGMETAYRA